MQKACGKNSCRTLPGCTYAAVAQAASGDDNAAPARRRREATNLERVVAQVRNGGGGMPPFRDALSAQQINDVSAYVVERIAR